MLAWYGSRSSDKSEMTRAAEAVAAGEDIVLPPVPKAAFLAHCAEECGLSRSNGMGPVPISAQELAAWADKTAIDLGPVDFQNILDAGKTYVAAWSEYNAKSVDPPWQPDMTPEEEAEARKAEERYFDMLMGARPINEETPDGA